MPKKITSVLEMEKTSGFYIFESYFLWIWKAKILIIFGLNLKILVIVYLLQFITDCTPTNNSCMKNDVYLRGTCIDIFLMERSDLDSKRQAVEISTTKSCPQIFRFFFEDTFLIMHDNNCNKSS